MIFPDSPVDEWLLALAGLLLALSTILTVLWLTTRRLYSVGRRMEELFGVNEDGLTVPQQLDAVVKDVKHLREADAQRQEREQEQDARMRRVEKQVFPNGGGSLLDKVKDLGDAVEAAEKARAEESADTRKEISEIKTLLESVVEWRTTEQGIERV